MKSSWKIRALVVAIAVAMLWSATALGAVTIKQKVGEKEYKFQVYGFSQMEMRGGDGQSKEGGTFFKAQRIRLGTKYFHGGWFAKLFLDFNQSYTSKEAGLPKVIKDAFVGYRWSDAAFIRMGMIKTPVGMDFTIPGWNLDIVERGSIAKGLVLERDFGLMLSGRMIGGDGSGKRTNGTEMGHEKWSNGFGYDIGVFNPAGRSSAVVWDSNQLGDALAYAMRIHYDFNKNFHTELSWGTSQEAGGIDSRSSEDYTVMDFGINAFAMDRKLHLKFEYIAGEDIRGEAGWDQTAWVATVGYKFTNQVEGVIKHYAGDCDRGDASTDLTNTYLGVNFYISPLKTAHRALQSHRIQVNYLMAGGDDASSDVQWFGIGGKKDDGWIMQWQYKF